MKRNSAIYEGSVMHRRVRPLVHRLRYRVFWLLLDLDEIDELAEEFWLFSRNSVNALSFFDVDHGDGSPTPLRLQIQRLLEAVDIRGGGAVRLLAMPRILNYVFNPLSVYFCYDDSDRMAAVVYEVHNTFGERHHYVLPVNASADSLNQSCPKAFYVSPFMDLEMQYEFRVKTPGTNVQIAILGYDADGPIIRTVLSGKHASLTDRALFSTLLRFPFLTMKVVAAIYWHALLLYLKGLRIFPRSRASFEGMPNSTSGTNQ